MKLHSMLSPYKYHKGIVVSLFLIFCVTLYPHTAHADTWQITWPGTGPTGAQHSYGPVTFSASLDDPIGVYQQGQTITVSGTQPLTAACNNGGVDNVAVYVETPYTAGTNGILLPSNSSNYAVSLSAVNAIGTYSIPIDLHLLDPSYYQDVYEYLTYTTVAANGSSGASSGTVPSGSCHYDECSNDDGSSYTFNNNCNITADNSCPYGCNTGSGQCNGYTAPAQSCSTGYSCTDSNTSTYTDSECGQTNSYCSNGCDPSTGQCEAGSTVTSYFCGSCNYGTTCDGPWSVYEYYQYYGYPVCGSGTYYECGINATPCQYGCNSNSGQCYPPPCANSSGYTCADAKDSTYTDVSCNQSTSYCQYGCNTGSGQCNGSPPPPTCTPTCTSSTTYENSSCTTTTCQYGCSGNQCLSQPTGNFNTNTLSDTGGSGSGGAVNTVVHPGSSSVLSWNVQNVLSCSISGTNGDAWENQLPQGQATTSPITVSTLYTIACMGPSGAITYINHFLVVPSPLYQEL